jgi:hypothetical protein
MADPTYVDLEVLAEVDGGEYLVVVSKKDLNSLVTFDEELVLRSWDGEKPVLLVAYGEEAVRTAGDTTEDNNLSNLPRLKLSDILDKR